MFGPITDNSRTKFNFLTHVMSREEIDTEYWFIEVVGTCLCVEVGGGPEGVERIIQHQLPVFRAQEDNIPCGGAGGHMHGFLCPTNFPKSTTHLILKSTTLHGNTTIYVSFFLLAR